MRDRGYSVSCWGHNRRIAVSSAPVYLLRESTAPRFHRAGLLLGLHPGVVVYNCDFLSQFEWTVFEAFCLILCLFYYYLQRASIPVYSQSECFVTGCHPAKAMEVRIWESPGDWWPTIIAEKTFFKDSEFLLDGYILECSIYVFHSASRILNLREITKAMRLHYVRGNQIWVWLLYSIYVFVVFESSFTRVSRLGEEAKTTGKIFWSLSEKRVQRR
jgi:hypothetical protein